MITLTVSEQVPENLVSFNDTLRARRSRLRAMESALRDAGQHHAAAFLHDMAAEMTLGMLSIAPLVSQCRHAAPKCYEMPAGGQA